MATTGSQTQPTDYVFTRDYLDNNRINLQHYLWVKLFGYLTHPAIPIEAPHLRIADVGTGTGIWLADIVDILPKTVQLEGLDISFDAVPPRERLPANIVLRHWDIKTDVPEGLIDAYDIVHIRNFAFVLRDDEAKRALESLVKMIKPGGYLQWAESDIASFRIEKTHPENRADALMRLLLLSQGQDSRLLPKWIPHLPQMFKDSGFESVEADIKEASPYMAISMHECNLLVPEMIARKTQNDDVAKGIRELMPEVAKETKDGACWAFTRWTVIGRKSRAT